MSGQQTWGLLAFLVGQRWYCEDFWSSLDQVSLRWPLLDVALAEIYLDDGRAALALPRLQRAVAALPEIWDLKLELAAARLELHDTVTASRLLAAVAEVGSAATRSSSYRLAETWVLEEHDPGSARRGYLALVSEDHNNHAARYRLAMTEHRLRNDDAALRLLRQLVTDAPGISKYRLLLARLAVQQGNMELYLTQARHVVVSDFASASSRGSVRHLLDVLQLGGLTRVYEMGVSRTGVRGSPDVTRVPRGVWVGTPGFVSLQQVEEQLLGLADGQ